MKKILVSIACVYAAHSAHAAEAPDADHRGLRIAATYQTLISDSLGTSTGPGPGVSGTYEFRLTPRFALGMNLAYRSYSGSPGLSQIGYGLLLRHALGGSDAFSPYLAYGLLLHINSLSDRPNTSTAHDTALAAGAGFPGFGQKLFFELAYHISHLRHFDSPVLNVSYAEAKLGFDL